MVKVSVPHIPKAILEAAATYSCNVVSLESATQRIAAFVRLGNLAVITGAGVSVDSGIRAYRGENGSYMNPNYRLGNDIHFSPARNLLIFADRFL